MANTPMIERPVQLPEHSGQFVVGVDPGSIAAELGIQPGDRLVQSMPKP